MTVRRSFFKKYVLFWYFFTCTLSSLVADEPKKPCSLVHAFDNPFPTTELKKIVDATVQIYGYLEFLEHNQDDEFIIDCIAGRSLRMFDAVEVLITRYHRGNEFVPDDIEYIITLLDRTIKKMQTKTYLPKVLPTLLMSCIAQLSQVLHRTV